jgi:biotin carboxylase
MSMIIVVEPTSSGMALIDAARQMGETVAVFRTEAGASSGSPDPAVIDMVLDTNDADAVFLAAQQLHATHGVKAILPGFEYVVDVVANAAARLGLPHLAQSAAALTRNKYLCRAHLAKAHLAVPRFALIDDAAQLEAQAAQVGFPAVLKPVDACGSLLVRRVDSLAQLKQVLADPDNTGLLDMGKQVGSKFLLEEFLVGREFSIEGFIANGQPQVVTVTEKHLGPEPFFVEMGHTVPAQLAETERLALCTYIEQVAQAIGLNLGVFHAEARLTARGPVLIEIAARLGGDRIYRLVELTHGISLPATMIRSYCAEPDPIWRTARPRHGVAGVRFLALDGEGQLGHADGLDQVRAMPGYEELELYFAAGDAVPELTDFRGRVGHILFTADERITVEGRLRQAENSISFLPEARRA